MSEQHPKNLLILGAGLFAEEIADMVSEIEGFNLTAFVEGIDRDRCQTAVSGYPVIWVEDLGSHAGDAYGVCAVGSPKRKQFVRRAAELGLRFTSVVHPTAHISLSSAIGSGTIVCPGCVVASHTTIGDNVIFNRGVLIGHHVTIGGFTTVSPGANVAGNVDIGEGAYIGMGANILDGITVGRHAVVGAGSVVTKDVPDSVQVVGVPAKIVKQL